MITDSQIADLLVELYGASSIGTATFDNFAPGLGPNGICWASKRVDIGTGGADVILLRGSVTFWDWFKDLMALASPFSHETLGPTHPGFTLGMDRCLRDIMALTKGPYVIAGHSLGAGRAAILTGLMVEAGIVPLRRVVFGSPKPGFQQLSDYISGIPGASYRNGDDRHHDLVTEVPFLLPPEEYVHPTPLIAVTAIPDPAVAAKWGLFKWHHMQLYSQALRERKTP